jgi:hypothetical protein
MVSHTQWRLPEIRFMREPGSITIVRSAGEKEWRAKVEQQLLSNPEKVPRLGQCYLCKAWQLAKSLSPIEIPDQAGYIQKMACQECLNKILNDPKIKEEMG